MKEPEYSSGYVLCLLQFVWHKTRLIDGHWAGLGAWLNGARDHLIYIKKPPRIPMEEWRRAKLLSYAACTRWMAMDLTYGECFDMFIEALDLLDLAALRASASNPPNTLDKAIRMDHQLGLQNVHKGEFHCLRPVP